MATLVFTALGTLVGGPLGGVLGAMAGREIDNSLFGTDVQGPRLKDLSVSTSTYGTAIARHFGQMRSAGSIIWATDLVEHASTSGGGKSSVSVTTYSYTSSFAVAVASRQILSIGRIWADGQLLRGAAGDLKVGVTLRIYDGSQDQAADPLIAANEGAANCPAFRGIAYVVFEDLQLADYGNRIPSLTFEVFADSGTLTLASLFEGWLEDVDADVPLTGIAGYSSDGAFNATLSQFQPVFPMDCDAGGSGLTLSRQRLQSAPIALGEPAVAAGNQGNFGGKHGFSRKLAPVTENPPRILRYYDIALDYQPGSQRAPGQPLPGQPKSIDLPAAITALNAFGLIAQTARNTNWARQTIAWRCAQLDPAVAPGAVVSLPDKAGQWRVTEWEWRDTGIELALERLAPTAGTSAAVYAGAASLAADVAVGASALFAYELPWDGTGSNAQTLIQAAVSSASSGWAGAAILVDDEAGALTQISASGRLRSTIGTTQGALPAASPLFFDRASTLDVQLLASDMALAGATARQLVTGANRALVGAEIIQFAGAAALGGGVWQLSGLLRGRGGTEAAIAGHAAGEPFVLLDSLPVTLDSSQIGADARIAALGLGDASAVEADIVNRGIGLKPLAPVHPNAVANADGSLTLGWTRRARGAWLWLDGVDVALQEESEAYIVCYGPLAAPLAMWSTPAAQLNLGASTLATLRGQLANGPFYVRQQGTSGLSTALFLATLS